MRNTFKVKSHWQVVVVYLAALVVMAIGFQGEAQHRDSLKHLEMSKK